MSENQSLTDEIVRLHDFFQDWFNGHGDRSVDEFTDALDDAFFIVSPTGTVSDKTQIVGMVASHTGTGPMEICIENVELKRSGEGGLLIATYEEHQKRTGGTSALISTAGFRTDESTPGGYRWLFVHETSMKGRSYEATPSSR